MPKKKRRKRSRSSDELAHRRDRAIEEFNKLYSRQRPKGKEISPPSQGESTIEPDFGEEIE